MGQLLALFFLLFLCSEQHVYCETTVWKWLGMDKGHSDTELRSKVVQGTVYDSQSAIVLSEKGAVRGKELLDKLQKEYAALQENCWSRAYAEMEAGCTQMLADDDAKSRFALKLAHCFLSTNGRRSKPCPSKWLTIQCTSRLDAEGLETFRSFFIDTTTACHILQSGAFRRETERVINALKGSAEWVEDELAQVARKSDAIFDKSSRVFALQQQLQDNLDTMRNSLASVAEDQEHMAEEQKALATLSSAIARNISQGHKLLLQGQQMAADGMVRLESQQLAAFESMRRMTEFAESHHEEMISFQGDMAGVQDRLLAGSSALLQAQDSFASKLGEMFTGLDRLFDMYNRLAIESRFASSLLFFSLTAALAYLLTSTPRTVAARPFIYVVLVANCVGEQWVARWHVPPDEELVLIARIRNASGLLAISALIYCAFTFRDYAVLSFHRIEAQGQQVNDIWRFVQKCSALTATPSIHTALDANRRISPQSIRERKDGGGDAAATPVWLSYVDAQASLLSDSDDPDYNPPPPLAFPSFISVPTKRSYNLRQSVRKKGRRLAGSAAMLQWEKVEDFTRLVLINRSEESRSEDCTSAHFHPAERCFISDRESKEGETESLPPVGEGHG